MIKEKLVFAVLGMTIARLMRSSSIFPPTEAVSVEESLFCEVSTGYQYLCLLAQRERVYRAEGPFGIDNIFISFITVSELYYGACKSQRVEQNLAVIRQLAERLNVVESDDAISEAFGRLKTSLEHAGKVIDDADIYIAACACVHGLTLVTNNTKHFRRIKGVKLDNWLLE